MEGNAAHRGICARSRVRPKILLGFFCIFAEHFKKVAKAEEQQNIWILALNLGISFIKGVSAISNYINY